MKKNLIFLVFILSMTGIFNSVYGQMEVMTYNIKYANERDGENSWSKRKDHLAKQIRFYEPDVFGVQEALHGQLEFLKENLEGYTYSGEGRDGEKKGEYSAIFYKKDMFRVLKEDTFWLSETPEKPSMGWDAAYPRICSFVLLENKETGRGFWIFNTHFDHRGDLARSKSSRMILEKINALNPDRLPVILMGDLNLEPDTEEVRYLSEHLNDSKAIASLVFGPVGTFNAYEFSKPVVRRIDYIFVSDQFRILKYAVLSDSKALKYPSDHLPVMVEAVLN